MKKYIFLIIILLAGCVKKPVYQTMPIKDRSATLSLTNINVGTTPNDGTGQTIRSAFQTINTNNDLTEAAIATVPTIEEVRQTTNDSINDLKEKAIPSSSILFLREDADTPGEAVTYEGMVNYVAANGGTGGGGYEYTSFIVGTTTGAPSNADTAFTISQMAGDVIELYRGTTTDLHKQWLNETATNGKTGYRYNSSGQIVVRPAWATNDRAIIKAVPSSAVSKITLAEAPSSILTGLMAYWKLDETSGSTVEDIHSTNDGTIAAGVTVNQAGIIEKAYAFNGSTGNVDMGAACRPTTAISVGFWFNIADITSGGDQWFVGNAVYSTNWCGYRVSINTTGAINFFLGTNTATMLDKSYSTGLDDGNDHHIVCTWDGTNAYIYVDNVKSTATAYSSNIVYVTACNLHLGSNAYADGTFYGGLLDEPFVLSRALSDAEVATLYGKSPYPFAE